jgi:hypothetical protein
MRLISKPCPPKTQFFNLTELVEINQKLSHLLKKMAQIYNFDRITHPCREIICSTLVKTPLFPSNTFQFIPPSITTSEL